MLSERFCLLGTRCRPSRCQHRPVLLPQAAVGPLGTAPLPPTPAQLFSQHPEGYGSFPSIPSTSPLLRQDRAAEASCRPLWHATSAFWLQHASCTQQQTETWQPLRSLHRPAEPSPASPTPYPLAFMGILHAHRTENRDPGWGLRRILA